MFLLKTNIFLYIFIQLQINVEVNVPKTMIITNKTSKLQLQQCTIPPIIGLLDLTIGRWVQRACNWLLFVDEGSAVQYHFIKIRYGDDLNRHTAMMPRKCSSMCISLGFVLLANQCKAQCPQIYCCLSSQSPNHEHRNDAPGVFRLERAHSEPGAQHAPNYDDRKSGKHTHNDDQVVYFG